MSELQRFELPPGEPEEQVLALLDRSDAALVVPAIDPPSVFRLIQDAGWDVAQALVPYLSDVQLQACVDLDAWRRQEFRPSHVLPWFAAMVAESDDATFKRQCRELDPEVLALVFKEYLLVDVWEEEGDVPESLWAYENVERSPDGVYALVYNGDDSTNALMRQGVARLYEVDMVLAWTLLEAVRWELRSTMEHEALRWRTSRLEEWGFVDLDEAMQIYRPRDGARFRERLEAGELPPKAAVETTVPQVLSVADADHFYFTRAAAALSAEELNVVMAEYTALQNRAMVAEGIDAADRSEIEVIALRTTGYLSIGLEFVSRADLEQATQILRVVAVRDLFRIGYTTVERLHENVQRLRRRPTLTLVEGQKFSLLRGADAALCEALYRVRPQYADATGVREIFRTQAQVDDAATRVAVIALKQLWLFSVMKVEPAALAQLAYGGALQNEPPQLSFDAFFATALMQVLIGERVSTDGLHPQQLGEVARRLRDPSWRADPLATFEPVVGPVFEALGGAGRLMSTWLDATLAWLDDELGAVTQPDAELLGDLLVLRAA